MKEDFSHLTPNAAPEPAPKSKPSENLFTKICCAVFDAGGASTGYGGKRGISSPQVVKSTQQKQSKQQEMMRGEEVGTGESGRM